MPESKIMINAFNVVKGFREKPTYDCKKLTSPGLIRAAAATPATLAPSSQLTGHRIGNRELASIGITSVADGATGKTAYQPAQLRPLRSSKTN